MEVFVAVALVGGFLAGVIASSRGGSFLTYFIIGALLPIVGIVLALLIRVDPLRDLTPAAGVGWWPDPTGRFDHRYFDGRRWTRYVGRNGQQFEDVL